MAIVKLTVGLVLVTLTLLYAGVTAQPSCTNGYIFNVHLKSLKLW